MPLNWNLLGGNTVGQSFLAGVDRGQEMRRRADAQGALAAYVADPDNEQAVGALVASSPELGLKVQALQREQRQRGVLSRLFEQPQTATGALSRVAPLAPQGALASMVAPASPIADPAPTEAAAAPAVLIDPAQLPPRTDGFRLNPVAMRELFAEAPELALKFQTMAFNAGEQQFKLAQRTGSTLARMAHHLGTLQTQDGGEDLAARSAELRAMMPQLAAMGVTAADLDGVDLSNKGLTRLYALGRNLDQLIDDERQDRRLEADFADDAADNARQDRATESLIRSRDAGAAQGWARVGISREGMERADVRGRRGQDMASADRRRGQDMVDRRAVQAPQGQRRPKVAEGATATGPNGQKAVFRGGQWVPLR